MEQIRFTHLTQLNLFQILTINYDLVSMCEVFEK